METFFFGEDVGISTVLRYGEEEVGEMAGSERQGYEGGAGEVDCDHKPKFRGKLGG